MPMTGIQRVQAALAGRPADCVPVVPEIIQHALNLSLIHISEPTRH